MHQPRTANRQPSPDTLEVRAGARSHVSCPVVSCVGACVSEFEQKNDNDKPKQVAETTKVGPPKNLETYRKM